MYNEFGFIEFIIYGFYIVFSILSLILFFKVWGMTNDINKIKQRLALEDEDSDYMLLYICGKHDVLYEKLNRELYHELLKDILERSDEEFIEYRDKLLEERKPYYDKIGKEIPQGFINITRSELG